MKPLILLVALAVVLLLPACAPQQRVVETRSTSGTAEEYRRAQREADQDRATAAAAATQKRIDDLQREVDALKQRDAAQTSQAALNKMKEDAATAAAHRHAAEASQPPAPSASPNAKAIDAEVAGIMDGKHGDLPPAKKLSGNSSGVASVKIKNDTIHTLTVLYSGPTSQNSVIAPKASKTINLAQGFYKIAAKVDDPAVIPFAGQDTLSGGSYGSTFYIVTSTR